MIGGGDNVLTVKKLNIHNNYSVATLINWEVEDTTEIINNFVFNVYASISPTSEFTKINEEPITGFSYMYNHPYVTDSSVKLYFKVEVVNTETQETLLCNVVSSAYLTPRDPIADTIIYQNEILLKRVLGRPPVKLLMKRRTGTRCTSCWDEDLMEVTKSSCTSCYSTGYAGGYLPPEDIYVSFTEPGFITRMDTVDIKDVQQGVTQAWCGNYPLILPGDIIIDEFNRRFIIMQVQPTTKSGRIYLRQLLQVQLLPPTDIIYKMKV